MDPPADHGTDGSSIRPVSSLLAKFEGLTKPGDSQPGTPTRNASPTPAPAPAPKPGRLRERDPSPSTSTPREPPPIPAMRPKDKLTLASLHPASANASASSSPIRTAHPPVSPRPKPTNAPALTVEPPHSPPKRGVGGIPTGDRPAFVSADSLVKSSSPATAGNQFNLPSRSQTPSSEPRKSPRMAPARPPSPPPPRRSVELRRERELGHKPPPSSGGSPDEGATPPVLPTRPRPQQPHHQQQLSHQQQQQPHNPPVGVKRSNTFHVGFDPPPLHHSLATKRRGKDEPLTPQITGDRPALPARPQSIIESVRAANSVSAPPPRPPRPGVNTSMATTTQQKRISSTPVTQAPPPIPRLNGRSMTVADRMPGRVSNDYHAPPPPPTPVEARPAESQIQASHKADLGYPDTSRTNRSKPYLNKGVHEIATKYDSRMFDVCGAFVCTTGSYTRAWNVMDGELVMSLAMSEGMKGASVAFKPGESVDEEGARIWIGTNNGELLEADVLSQSIVNNRPNVHGRYEIIKIYRHFNELWTLDESGTLHVWGPADGSNLPSLASPPTQTFRVPKGHVFSMVVGDELWHATGKEIRVFLPTLDGRTQFQVLIRPLVQDGAGEVTSGTLLASDPDKVFFGHNDGKVSIYSRKTYSCLGVMNISQYKINSLAGAGRHLWAGYNTGKISVYDMGQTPWSVKKDWQAHENPVVKLISDQSSFYKLDRHQVVSLGADNMLRVWDGLLQDDWLQGKMKENDARYCQFEKIKALILTWNAGASTPNSLNYSSDDRVFIENLLRSSDSPDIIVFGFQELVDLEDKTLTAKRFLKPKKKEGTDQERMSHQYRNWLEHLKRSLDQHMNGELYHVLHSAPLVGLFTAIFVKADLLGRISNLNSAEVKRGMGGLHGNKGAIVVRFMVDDTSLCFINCHLAAGQSGATQRHNDIAAILEASLLPSERDASVRFDSFVGGGDGTMILDHELCLLNGDLNYRIDTMSRDTVVTAVKAGNLGKLLERDQLLVARRRNPGFRLRAFEELPITFAPTYKYDVGTDNYDTSEKRRSPAWCDRLLYRCGAGRGRIEQLDYRRHEVRVSDHRPVSGRFRFEVKRVRGKERAQVWMECHQEWEDLRGREGRGEKFYYLTNVIGYDEATATQLIEQQQRSSRSAVGGRRDHRSPSGHRE
ncbi:Endonuclease/exonuclease/phosphatase [Apiosordaria backusii]|uniref:Endonuclease/exonuclease/phosphatase n=1 Tax=Apiosordaria backusii TaxID=314023 RepID=A0AA40BSS2_9PEZI|nr:Endonuclease/exonuclease/phosphatase [Apiosordaria backusii]